MIKIASLVIIILGTSVSGCTSNRERFVTASTGLDSCILKRAKLVAGDTPDMTRMEFELLKDCKYRFMDSLSNSAGANCLTLLLNNKSCYYNLKERSVIIHSIGDGKQYTVEFY